MLIMLQIWTITKAFILCSLSLKQKYLAFVLYFNWWVNKYLLLCFSVSPCHHRASAVSWLMPISRCIRLASLMLCRSNLVRLPASAQCRSVIQPTPATWAVRLNISIIAVRFSSMCAIKRSKKSFLPLWSFCHGQFQLYTNLIVNIIFYFQT